MVDNEDKIKNLEDVIQRKDTEIIDIKNSLANILQQIRDLNEKRDEIIKVDTKKEISNLCTNTIYELTFENENEKAKIIELPNTNQSNK